MLWKIFVIFTLRPSDLFAIDLRSYGRLLSLFPDVTQNYKNISQKKKILPTESFKSLVSLESL